VAGDQAGPAEYPAGNLDRWNMNEENSETEICAYCGAECAGGMPANEAEWAAEAQEHAQGCEWIETRAFTLCHHLDALNYYRQLETRAHTLCHHPTE